MSIPIVRAKGLTKLFGSHKAVDDISFDIWPAEIVGFLGPNGAGKTTTIRMLLNILRPNTGHLEIFGETYAAARKKILQQMNASSGTLTLPGKLSVHDNLHIFADLYGIDHAGKRVDELIEKFDLTKYRHRQLYSLSTGQQVRVSLAKAFINRPRLLLLDEPTSSLDPEMKEDVVDVMSGLARDGLTMVIVTHEPAVVNRIATRILRFGPLGRIEEDRRGPAHP
jgi:ABC-2 type transport system ATP-binding protein